MPLFISADHWKIANQWMKPVMGWVTTLDPLGYTYQQVKTVPFLVLACALRQFALEKTSFRAKQIRWLMETCDQVYQQTPSIKEEVTKQFENYLNDAAQRTIDVVPNNFVFLGWLWCAIRAGSHPRLPACLIVRLIFE